MVIDARLVFDLPHDGNGRLVFGERESAPPVPGRTVAVDATFAGELYAHVLVYRVSGVSRGVIKQQSHHWQDATPSTRPVATRWHSARPQHASHAQHWQDASTHRRPLRAYWRGERLTHQLLASHWQDATHHRNASAQHWQDTSVHRVTHAPHWQDAQQLQHASAQHWRDMLRLRALAAQHWQDATAVHRLHHMRAGYGTPVTVIVAQHWQDAIRPPIGKTWGRLGPDDGDWLARACYDPATIGRLVFEDAWTPGDGLLVFICRRHHGAGIVVPVQRTYIVTNAVRLTRDGVDLHALSLSMSLDADSWTWSFSARVPGRALPLLMPDSNGPVHVEATINGVPYRFIVEKVQRDRSFNSSVVSVSGRGRAAILDAPYAPTRDFMNAEARTSRQLLDYILTDNGVSIGWDVEWGLTAWMVPAGVFSHQGTYISAMNAVAQSAGGYLQPHNTDQTVVVNHRYPVLPWDWADVEPDFVIPSAVATVEGIEWQDLPAYNRVFVSGQAEGVLGRATRSGTAGDYLAPMVVDPLITHADAARQRGEAILSETGRIANVTLRMPVLALTGIIPPGKFVRYTDGADTRVGITRAVSVDVGLPQVWQTLALETHE